MFKKQHTHRLIRQEECILKYVMVFQAFILEFKSYVRDFGQDHEENRKRT
jgi:hypothetical protein